MNVLLIHNPQEKIDETVVFLGKVFNAQGKFKVVIAVSGGIDSALALTVLAKALPAENIFPIFLPFNEQSTQDSQLICEFNRIPGENWQEINIGKIVEQIAATQRLKLELAKNEVAQFNVKEQNTQVRLGNIMARTRMIIIYDLAKKLDALVCGTENKSEKYLGYFTRFGDEASDIEPVVHLYKAQIRQLAEFLKLPQRFIDKVPSAGLWSGQTDEEELGFSYELADQVLYQLIDLKKKVNEIELKGVSAEVVQKVIARVKNMEFKQKVPYWLVDSS